MKTLGAWRFVGMVWAGVSILMPSLLSAGPYPSAPRSEVVDMLHGVSVPDPYRWLEDVDSEATKRWVQEQNELSEAYFAHTPGRDIIRKRLEEIWNYDKLGVPALIAGRIFFSRKSGLQEQSVLYWQEDKPGAELKILLDGNTLSPDGTIALTDWSVSEDGKLMAYALSTAGSDWAEWKVREVDTGLDRPDHLTWIKFSGIGWAPDQSGFYYSRYPEPAEGQALEEVNLNQKLYYHKLGDPQSEDQLVYERPDKPYWGFSSAVSEDERYLYLGVWQGAGGKNAFFYKDLQRKDSRVEELISDFENSYELLGNDGSIFYFRTDHQAPNYRIIAIDSQNPKKPWREVLPESIHLLESVTLIGNRLVTTYQADVVDKVEIYDLYGKLERQVTLPENGSVTGFVSRRSDKDTFFGYSTYLDPPTIYRYTMASGEYAVFAQPKVAFDGAKFVTEQRFFPSQDGTEIPMFIIRRKDLELNGQNPTYLYGYGGFNISLTPNFSPGFATWLEMGGTAAVVNLRGGGEYGESWHQAGTKERKQNVFDDFQAAAEFLIKEGYTNSSKLAIAGGSNGGLLVGACVNQRPDLYAAAIADVGVFDMLRFHKFTIGWAWTDDYGDPDKADEFPALYKYSPYHNTQKEKPYPAILIATADHDDRVFPAHSFKFGAALQAAQPEGKPILMRIETKAGHGAGKPTSKYIEEIVDKWSFLARELGMQIPEHKE